jgi:TetR/AcrR family transcriptional repressor for divergent bdcA
MPGVHGLPRPWIESRSRSSGEVGRRGLGESFDYVLVNLRGLSSFACLGYTQEKLVECSKIAGRALEVEFK